jgi:hypothetical protein
MKDRVSRLFAPRLIRGFANSPAGKARRGEKETSLDLREGVRRGREESGLRLHPPEEGRDPVLPYESGSVASRSRCHHSTYACRPPLSSAFDWTKP